MTNQTGPRKLGSGKLLVLLLLFLVSGSSILQLATATANGNSSLQLGAAPSLSVGVLSSSPQKVMSWSEFMGVFSPSGFEAWLGGLIPNVPSPSLEYWSSQTKVSAAKFIPPEIQLGIHPMSTVTINLTQSGLGSDVSSGTNVFTVDGTNYTKSQLPYSFTWTPTDCHLITAISPISGSISSYQFSSWTNTGAGCPTNPLISQASGYYYVPGSGTTVTANYATHVLGATSGPGGAYPRAKVITNAGTNKVIIDTSVSAFGGSSAEFTAASSEYLTTPSSTGFDFGTGAYTLSGWFELPTFPSSTGRYAFVSWYQDSNNWWWWDLENNSGTYQFNFEVDNASTYLYCHANSSPNLSASTLYYLAVDRDGSNNTKFWQDGNQVGSTCTTAYTIGSWTGLLYVGQSGLGTNYMNGWIDDLQIDNGATDYTTTFSNPTSAWVRNSKNSLILHFDGPQNATTGIGFQDDAQTGQVLYTKATLTDPIAVIQSLSFQPGAGSSGRWQASIYSDSSGPATLQVYCPSQTITGTTVETVSISSCTPSSLTLTSSGSTAYWLAVQLDFTALSTTPYSIEASYNSGSSNTGAYQFQAYGTPPSSASATLTSENYSVFANYQVGTSITFTQSGLGSDVSGGTTVLTIDSTPYTKSALPVTLTLLQQSTHSVAASTPITGSSSSYNFSSWTNGDGLSASSGTYTVPTSTTTVTANYTTCAVVTTAYSGGSSGADIAGGTVVLSIDSVNKTQSQTPVVECGWTSGGTHTISSVQTLTGTTYIYDWSSWTNGDGLPNAYTGGTYTVPNPPLTVTANFTARPKITWAVCFQGSDAGACDGPSDTVAPSQVVLTIDGTTHAYSTFPFSINSWISSSPHTVAATTPISGSTYTYNWGSWTNGDGLSTSSGTYTTPGSDITVTVNFLTLKKGITFSVNGLGSDTIAGTEVFIIDSTAYYWQSGNPALNQPITFQWAVASAHTVEAISCIGSGTCTSGTNDGVTYVFSNWVNGDSGGMNNSISTSQSYVVPNANENVISSYVFGPSVTVQYSGLGSDVSGGTSIIIVDGVSKALSAIPLTYNWIPNSIHYFAAFTPVTGSSFTYLWDSWTCNPSGSACTGLTRPSNPAGYYVTPTASGNYTIIVNFSLDPMIFFQYIGLDSSVSSSTVLIQVDSQYYTRGAFDACCSGYQGGIPFSWAESSTHAIAAQPNFQGSNGITWYFNSWTNGDGLSGTSGTYTTPALTQIVYLNYSSSTGYVWCENFNTGGADVTGSDVLLTIDGTNYTFTQLATCVTFAQPQWPVGSTHMIYSWSPIVGSTYTYNWSSWTNGDGLTGTSGTYTTPSSGVTITVNYVAAITTLITWTTSGLGSDVSGSTTIVTIDGSPYTKSLLPHTFTSWTSGGAHSVNAAPTITGSLYTYYFVSWINGDGLGTYSSGTYTTPSGVVTVVANYATSTTVQVILGQGGIVYPSGDVSGSAQLFTIDGAPYTFSQLTSFQWVVGSTHSVTALTPIQGSLNRYCFNNWAGIPDAGGLVDALGTYTTPAIPAIVTANYGLCSLIQVQWHESGLALFGTNYMQGGQPFIPWSWSNVVEASKVTVAKTGTITYLSVYASQSSGSQYVMGLYSDSGGYPNSLLAYTNSFYTLIGYNNELLNTGVYETAGTTVWIIGNTASLDRNIQGSTGSGTFIDRAYVYNGNLPSTYPSGGTSSTGTGVVAYGYGDVALSTVVLTIDGTPYDFQQLCSDIICTPNAVFNWPSGLPHTIVATTPITGITNTYTFSSWTNGDGLVTASGTFTVPTTSPFLVTVNYATNGINFEAPSLGSDVAGSQVVFQIDSVPVTKSQLPLAYPWSVGSGHSISTVSPIVGSVYTYYFASWTGGDGLIGASGTYTTPSGAQAVIANFTTYPTVQIVFGQTGLGSDVPSTGDSARVYQIDGAFYYKLQLPISMPWVVGSTHSVYAMYLVFGTTGVQYEWQSWTNGDGLSVAGGIYTTPSSSTFVVANYVTLSPEFSMTASSYGLQTLPGSSVSDRITITNLSGSPAVGLSCAPTSLPTGVTCSFNPASGTGNYSSTLTISTTLSTPLGTCGIVVIGAVISSLQYKQLLIVLFISSTVVHPPEYVTNTVTSTPIVTVSTTSQTTVTTFPLLAQPQTSFITVLLLLVIPFICFTAIGYEAVDGRTSEGPLVGAAIGAGLGIVINSYMGYLPSWVIILMVVVLGIAISVGLSRGSR